MKFLRILKIVAIVLLCLAGAGLLYQNQFTTQNLTANYFHIYEVDQRSENRLDSGMEAFERADYKKAIEEFSKIDKNDALYYNAQFFLGQAYFKTKQFGKASSAFLPAYNANVEYPHAEAGAWFLALSALNVNEDIGIRYLERIMKSTSSYRGEARALMEDLASWWHR